MKEVIILTPGPFLKRDYERFGIELLKKNFISGLTISSSLYTEEIKIIDLKNRLKKENVSINEL